MMIASFIPCRAVAKGKTAAAEMTIRRKKPPARRTARKTTSRRATKSVRSNKSERILALRAARLEVSKKNKYEQLIRRIRKTAARKLPTGSTVLVVTKGDDRLLELDGRTGWHFPQDGAGAYPGYPAANSILAIVQMEGLRSKGAQFLLFPESASWWLNHYSELGSYLERHYRGVVCDEKACVIFDLRVRRTAANGDTLSEIREILEECDTRLGREPSVMNWNSGTGLAAAFPERAVFSAATDDGRLPYLDGSVDVIVLASPEPKKHLEAARVAALAVVELNSGKGETTVECKWASEWTAAKLPSLSIVIPTFNGLTHLKECLGALQDTIPRRLDVEIIVIDDASTDGTRSFLKEWAEQEFRLKVIRTEENSGFIVSSNRGADEARGEILVFLNDDTVPLPGWLPPLVQTFLTDPTAGAVGGKLIYPDGTLQEAGGVIFSDGSGANFGRHDIDPGAPLYSYVREVDYCSGALLATRRSLFWELGGFDVAFVPAYYEDTDYCFKVRKRGFRVLFQPRCTVIHFEGASSGTDLTKGTKRFQSINRKKFRERWKAELTGQSAAPGRYNAKTWSALAVRNTDGLKSKRLLLCSPVMPEFDREGGSRRIFHMLEFLQADGWRVTFVAQHAAQGSRYERLLQQRGIETHVGFGEATDDLISAADFDLAILVFWDVAEQHIEFLRTASPRTLVIVDSIDLHFLRNARRIFSLRQETETPQLLGPDYGSEMAREMNVYAAADGVLAVSEKEASLVDDLAGEPGLSHVVKLAEDFPLSPIPRSERSGILFLGNFRHTPNIDAFEFLCRDILPLIDPALLALHPLVVVGNGVDDTIREIAAGLANVRVVGWVPSIQTYLEHASISVIPLLYGAGTKTKLIQSLMSGTPAVSTTIGIEGLGVRHEEHVLVADNAPAFARGIERLLTEEKLWEHISQTGREYIEPRHGFDAVKKQALAAIGSVLNRKPKRARMAETNHAQPWRISQRYHRLVAQVRDAVSQNVPAGANVAVINKGDHELVRFQDRSGWHFPQDEIGNYTGYHPADGSSAISHLKDVSEKGADFLVIPATMFWWLEHYDGLSDFLERRCDLIYNDESICAIYRLPADADNLLEIAGHKTLSKHD